MKVSSVAMKKATKLAVAEEDMLIIRSRGIKLFWMLLIVLTSGCAEEELTYYRWQHDDYLAKVYSDMEQIGRLNARYAEGEMEYLQYAEELAAVLKRMENHLTEFRGFLRDNRKELQKAGINVTESEVWAETQLRLTGEIALELAGKLEEKGYRGEVLEELKRTARSAGY